LDGQIADKMAKQHIQNRKPVQEDIIEEPGSIHEWQI
jgi:hypothetical protein